MPFLKHSVAHAAVNIVSIAPLVVHTAKQKKDAAIERGKQATEYLRGR